MDRGERGPPVHLGLRRHRPRSSGRQRATGEVLATLDCKNASAASVAVAAEARAIDARQHAVADETARMKTLLDGGFIDPNSVEVKQAEAASEEAKLASSRAKLAGDGPGGQRLHLARAVRRRDRDAHGRPGRVRATGNGHRLGRGPHDRPHDNRRAGDRLRRRGDRAARSRLHVLATSKTFPAAISRRSPSARPRHADGARGDRRPRIRSARSPSTPPGEVSIEVGDPVEGHGGAPRAPPRSRGEKAAMFVVENGVAQKKTFPVLGEKGSDLFLDPSLRPGTLIVTEGQFVLSNGEHVAGQAGRLRDGASHGRRRRPARRAARDRHVPAQPDRDPDDLYRARGLLGRRRPAHGGEHLPELTPPVLIIGTLAPGLAAKDIEKTLSWRLEKYVSATPGVDHVESISRITVGSGDGETGEGRGHGALLLNQNREAVRRLLPAGDGALRVEAFGHGTGGLDQRQAE